MLDDKALTDKVVELGVGRWQYLSVTLTPKQFVEDWRVAGALMERVETARIIRNDEDCKYRYLVDAGDELDSVVTENDSLPRAIVEACVRALEK